MNDDPRSDDPRIDDAARWVQDAVTAHGRTVQPDEDGSLPVIRHRVASARRRRLVGATALGAAAALVIGVAIGVAAGGDDTTTVAVGDGGSTTTTEPCPPSTPSPSSTTTTAAPSTASIPTTSTTITAPDSAEAGGPSTATTVPANAPLTAVPETTIPADGEEDVVLHEAEENGACVDGTTTTEPPTTTAPPSTPSVPATSIPADAVPVVFPTGLPVPPGEKPPDFARDPVATARAFLQSVGVDNPSLSEYDPQTGQIIYGLPSAGQQGLDVVRSVLTMIERNDHTWAVREARSPSIVIDSHRVLETADGRFLDLYGEGRGYEGTIVARAEGTGDVAGTARAFTTASGGPELLPFVLSLDLRGVPRVPVLRVVLTNESGEDGSAVDVTAFIVGSA